MNESELKEVLTTEIANKYPVDQIDPREGHGTWVEKRIKIFTNGLPGGIWNEKEAKKYFHEIKQAIEKYIKNNKFYTK